eukprot:98907_1
MATKKRGLKNQGATCYLNTMLQIMYSIDEIREKFESTIVRHPIQKEIQIIFKKLSGRSQVALSTKRLTKAFGWSNEDIKIEHDLNELYIQLIPKLELIAHLFTGKIEHTTECSRCLFQSVTHESCIQLDVPIIYKNLTEFIGAQFGAHEVLSGTNRYQCDECGRKTKAYKRTKAVKWPEILTFNLKRYKMDRNMNRIKVTQPFIYPQQIDCNAATETPQPIVYTLFAIACHHSHSASHGHYSCVIYKHEKWYLFDDTLVKEVDVNRIKNNAAYMLFYRRT